MFTALIYIYIYALRFNSIVHLAELSPWGQKISLVHQPVRRVEVSSTSQLGELLYAKGPVK